MKIQFTEDKTKISFLHESGEEYRKIVEFPGFEKTQLFHTCPSILPVAYNIIARCEKYFKNVTISKEVQKWLEQDFKLKELPESFKYFTKPKDFQDIALRFLYTLNSGGVLLEPGMGKSKVVLDYIYLLGLTKVIIVCPKPLMFVWEDEIKIHRPELSFYSVQTTDWELEKEGIRSAQVTIINYNKVVTMKHSLMKENFQLIHLDEFLIKDHSTQRTISTTELARGIPYRVGGSGTLINNSPVDAFAPVRYLQKSLVGGSHFNFEKYYTVRRKNKETNKEIVVGFRNTDEVRSILESCCIVMTKEKWLKLPAKHIHDIEVAMGPSQREAYFQLLKNFNLQLNGNTLIIENSLVMMSKLNQISNGFIYFSEETEDEIETDLLAGEDSKTTAKKKAQRKTEFFNDCGKIEALRKLLTQTIEGKRAIIWFNMEAEFFLIERLLKELGHTYLSIKGGEKNIGDKIRSFNKDPSISWLVCQAKSVNYGVTVMGTKKKDLEDSGVEVLPGMEPGVYTEVFYSMSFSAEVYTQQQDRIHRLGQENECHYYRIFSKSPVERRVKNVVDDKIFMRKQMLVDVAESLIKEEEGLEEDSAQDKELPPSLVAETSGLTNADLGLDDDPPWD